MGILLLVPFFALRATPTVGTPTATPSTIFAASATSILVTCAVNTAIGDPALMAGGVNLLRLTSTGADNSIIGAMYDDGTHGDVTAHDGIYSLQFPTTEASTGTFGLSCGAAFSATIQRVRSAVATVTVQPAGTPPTITGISPSSGPAGTLVTVTGTGLATSPQLAVAQLGGGTINPPVSSDSATQITFVMPAGATTGTIGVGTPFGNASSSTSFTVTPSSTFSVSASPASASVIQGQTVSYSVSVASTNGFSQLAQLSVSGVPSGVTASFRPTSITTGQTSVLTLTAPSNQAVATSSLSVSAAATVDGIPSTQSAPASLTVVAPTTSFLGRTVVADQTETPLAGVVISTVGQDGAGNTTSCTGHSTVSDSAGNFALTNLPASCVGPQLIAFNGDSVTSPAGVYAGLQLVFTLVSGSVVVSPVLVHLPEIDTAETFNVIQNDTVDQTYAFKTIPGLSITVYAGTTFTKQDGTKPNPFPLAAVDVPVDRLPDVMPTTTAGIGAFIVAFQPAESNATQGVAVWFPNTLNTPPGTSVPLMTLNPTLGRMAPYGTGTISTDGSTIIPDIDPSTGSAQHRYGIVHFDWHGPVAGTPNQNDPPPTNNGPCSCNGTNVPKGDDPVDLASGVDVQNSTDITLAGNRGTVAITRTYRTLAAQGTIPGPFGWGTSDNYDYRLDTLSPQSSSVINLILPTGTRIPFTLQADGSLINLTVPMVSGWKMTTSASGTTTLTQKDGTMFSFVPGIPPTGSVLTAITDPNGNVTSIVRAPGAPYQISEIDDAVGRKLTFQYNGYTISQITDPIGRTVHYTYDGAGYLATVTDIMGGVTSYQYDSQGRVTQITDPHSGVTKLTYDANGRVASMLNPDGGKTTYAYTLVNALIANSPVTQTVVTDPLGNVTTYRFNTVGFVVGVTDATGQTRTINRQSGTNYILSMTGTGTCTVCGDTAAGDITFTYDPIGNMLSKTDALGKTWSFTYDAVFSHLTSTTDPLGNVTTRTYDSHGNLIQVTDARGNSTLYTRNSTGLVTATQDPAGQITKFTYDSSANLILVTDPLGQKTQLSYDGVSRLIARLDPLGRLSTSSYNAAGQVTAQVDGNGNSVAFAYDVASLLTSWTDSNGNQTKIGYDASGRVTSQTDPLNRVKTFQYDHDGNLVNVTNRRGQNAVYSYDPLNRVSTETYVDATVNRQYDSSGRLSQVVDSQAGTFSLTYDADGRLTKSATPNGVITFSRDADGRVTSRQVQGQTAVSYTYDANSNLTGASLGSTSVTRTYDVRNLLTAATRSNGVNGTYSYDALGRLLSIGESAGSGSLFSRAFSYDAASQITGNTVDTGVALSSPANAGAFDAANEITALGGKTYTSDADGNRLTEATSAGTTKYKWDARGRLQSITTPDSAVTSFIYDPAGQMIQQSVAGNGQTSVQQYILDDALNIVSIQQGDSSTSVLDGRGPDDVMATVQGGAAVFPLADQTGSKAALTDGSGNVVGREFYDPFGHSTTTGTVGLFQFTGRPAITADLYYDRARFYDAAAGRFLSEDPTGLAGGTANLYLYAHDNPLLLVDPMGLNPQLSYTTLGGGPHQAQWQIQWNLSGPSKKGGWIVQQINATTASGQQTTYWEAWQVAAGSNQTTYADTGDPNDDLFQGFSQINSSARFYEGLNLPDSFVPGGVKPAGILPATTTNPNLPCNNASAPVNRNWKPTVN